MSLPTAKYRTIFEKWGGSVLIDPRLIEAIAMTESSGQTDAVREEPQIDDASRGLMQVLERTAKNLGLTGSADQLFEPNVGVEYGVKTLVQNLDAFNKSKQQRVNGTYAVLTEPLPREVRVALARYNGGSKKNPSPVDGSLRNEPYVKKVEKWFRAVVLDTAQGGPLGLIP